MSGLLLLFVGGPIALAGAAAGAIVSTNKVSGAAKGAAIALGGSLAAFFIIRDTDGFTLPSETFMPDAHNAARTARFRRALEEGAAKKAKRDVIQ